MKLCKSCGEEKPLELFYKRSGTKDGRYGVCKSCAKAYQAEKRKADPDHYKAQCAEWYRKNAEYAKDKAREWHNSNRERRTAYVRANSEAAAARTANRRALYKHGCETMSEGEYKQVQDLYWLAKDLKAVSGEDYHVDHIIPLSKGGEHRLHNLQILHAEDNLRKGAKLP